jgi:hypothetical protein
VDNDAGAVPPRLSRTDAAVNAKDLGNLLTDIERRVQAGQGLLEDHANAVAAYGTHVALAEL